MKKFLMLALLATVAAVPAMAEDAKTPAEMDAKVTEWIKQADTDGNGTISKDEFTADAGKKFDAGEAEKADDKSKDDYIADAGKMFDEADTNKDGQLSKEEKLVWKAAEKKS